MRRAEDDELVSRIEAGCEDATTEFCTHFRQKCEAVARKRGVPRADCVDVAQDILITALRQIREGQFRRASTLATWLYPIVNAGIANYFRKRGRTEIVPLDAITEKQHGLIATGNLEAVVAVREALSRIPARDQLLLILYEQQHHTLEEIGPTIGLRKSAVAEALKVARERFRKALAEGGKSLPPRRLKE